MNISISNICWKKGKENFPSFLDALSANNVYGVELGVNCIWEEPAEISQYEIQWLKKQLNSRSISLVSLHSLTYTRPDLSLFKTHDSYKDLVSYMENHISIARELECQNLVFGSPKARLNYVIMPSISWIVILYLSNLLMFFWMALTLILNLCL